MDKKFNEYEIWRNRQFTEKIGFFPIFSDFKPYIKNLSPGAVTLYLYLGLHSNYQTGESFHSIKKISIFFNRSTRTISNWIKELENAELIIRKQKKLNGVSHTYIVPYNWEPGILYKRDILNFLEITDDDIPY